MDFEEIRRSYRGAKNQKEQIGRLAELNDCTKEDICMVLRLGEMITMPQSVRQAIRDCIAALDANIKVLQLEREELAAYEKGDVLVTRPGNDNTHM